MSVVAGLVSGGKVWLAGDSLVDDDGVVFEALDSPKVFKWNDFVFGVCGDARICDLIYAVFDPPRDDNSSPYHYMVADFIPELRNVLIDGGAIPEEFQVAEEGSDRGFELIVGYEGQMFLIGDDFSVCTLLSPYYAIGAGGVFAFASLAATSAVGQIKDPAKRVEKAVGAAIKRRRDCGGSVYVVSG